MGDWARFLRRLLLRAPMDPACLGELRDGFWLSCRRPMGHDAFCLGTALAEDADGQLCHVTVTWARSGA